MEVVKGRMIEGKGDVKGKGAGVPKSPAIKREQTAPKGKSVGRPNPPG